jgi:hypothetical protein
MHRAAQAGLRHRAYIWATCCAPKPDRWSTAKWVESASAGRHARDLSAATSLGRCQIIRGREAKTGGVKFVNDEQIMVAVQGAVDYDGLVTRPPCRGRPIKAVAQHLGDADDRGCVPRRFHTRQQQCGADFALPQACQPDPDAAALNLIRLEASQQRARCVTVRIGRVSEQGILLGDWPGDMRY